MAGDEKSTPSSNPTGGWSEPHMLADIVVSMILCCSDSLTGTSSIIQPTFSLAFVRYDLQLSQFPFTRVSEATCVGECIVTNIQDSAPLLISEPSAKMTLCQMSDVNFPV
jgi:hypothetical protein